MPRQVTRSQRDRDGIWHLVGARFDLDGTLVDTAPLHVRTEREALSYLGVGNLSSDHPDTFGMGLEPGTEALARHYDLGSAQDVMNVYGLCQISGREKREAVDPPGLLAYAAAISASSA